MSAYQQSEWKPNTEGIWLGLSEQVYHSSPGLSRTMLDALDPTPDGLPAYLETPWEPKAWATIGTCVHSLVLEPSKPLSHLVVQPKEIWSAADNKMVPWSGEGNKPKVRAKWKADMEASGKIIVTAAEMEQITACAEAIASNKEPEMRDLLQQIFSKGQSEVSCYRWCNVGETRILLRCRIDWVPDESSKLWDIKTTGEFGTTEAGLQSIANDNLIQPAHYGTVWNTLGDHRDDFGFIAVEKKKPWRCRPFTPDSKALELGQIEWERRLNVYAGCIASGRFGGWPAKIINVGLPGWRLKQLESV